jgi:hypothetical protein
MNSYGIALALWPGMLHRTFATALILILTVGSIRAHAEETIVTTQRVALTQTAPREAARPRLLPKLYASYAGLQAYDVYSTRQALSRAAVEANPLMQQAAQNSSAMIALKAGVTVGTIVAAERMWKNNNKMGAIAVLVASNGVAAFVAARNARTLQNLR